MLCYPDPPCILFWNNIGILKQNTAVALDRYEKAQIQKELKRRQEVFLKHQRNISSYPTTTTTLLLPSTTTTHLLITVVVVVVDGNKTRGILSSLKAFKR